MKGFEWAWDDDRTVLLNLNRISRLYIARMASTSNPEEGVVGVFAVDVDGVTEWLMARKNTEEAARAAMVGMIGNE